MEGLKQAAEKAGLLLEAETKLQGGKAVYGKNRIVTIYAGSKCYTCTLELDISFMEFQADGTASNKAEVFLLPEEFPCFTSALQKYVLPLPAQSWLRFSANPNIISVSIESKEPPEHFAERLAAALGVIEQAADFESFLFQAQNHMKRGVRDVSQI